MEKKQPKICFFNSHKSWGGGEKWHYDAASFLSRNGWSVLLAADRKGDLYRKARNGHLEVYGVRISNSSFLNPLKVFKLIRFFRWNNIDTIILNLPADLKVAGIAARLAGLKKIIYRRGSAIPIQNTFLNRFLFGHVLTDVIANSEETRRTLLKNNPNLVSKEKIHVIYNGIDLENYDKQAVTPPFQFGSDTLVLGHAGRLSKEKNQRFLIDVAVHLKRQGVDFKLLIAGTGELETDLKSYAHQQGVESEVLFLGFVKDIKSFMYSIDVFLLSSWWEGFGYVLVEAMAAGKPVVAFDSSSTPEIVDDGVNGYLVEPRNVREYAEKILELDEDKRISFGQAARGKVESCFESEKNLSKLQVLLGGRQ